MYKKYIDHCTLHFAKYTHPLFLSRQPVTVQLKFWSNGFSLDEGPLRMFDDPANREFLNSIEKG